MSVADLETNRKARRVLVRHWIDLGRLAIRAAAGSISVRGELVRIAGMQENITSAVVETIFSEMKRTTKVKRMQINLTNWANLNGKWVPASADNAGNVISPSFSATSVQKTTIVDVDN